MNKDSKIEPLYELLFYLTDLVTMVEMLYSHKSFHIKKNVQAILQPSDFYLNPFRNKIACVSCLSYYTSHK